VKRAEAAAIARAVKKSGVKLHRNIGLYRIWCQMRRRCDEPTHRQFPDYGGREIKVCERWRNFHNFVADVGPRPPGGLLDRTDNNRGYEPGNCRWATRTEQNSNRRNCIFVILGGERVTLKEACRRKGLSYRPIHKRVYRGWPIERALAVPVGEA
jgi:hypothetical protein